MNIYDPLYTHVWTGSPDCSFEKKEQILCSWVTITVYATAQWVYRWWCHQCTVGRFSSDLSEYGVDSLDRSCGWSRYQQNIHFASSLRPTFKMVYNFYKLCEWKVYFSGSMNCYTTDLQMGKRYRFLSLYNSCKRDEELDSILGNTIIIIT